MADELLTQKEAALVLRVSTRYLRNSDCPKVLLPPARGRRPLVRYRRADVMAWADAWSSRASVPQRRAS
jgi:hypothetical protein